MKGPPPTSPPVPVAPPMKKQRAGGTPQGMSAPPPHSNFYEAKARQQQQQQQAAPPKPMKTTGHPKQTDDSIDNAITRRRAQIAALQQQRDQQTSVLNRARSQLHPGATTASDDRRGPPTAPGIPPPGTAVARVRNSDIFPTVPKTQLDLNNIKQQLQTQQNRNNNNMPPGASLARRLDASFSASKQSAVRQNTRAKSAPPSRPPPPPPPKRTAVPTAAAAAPPLVEEGTSKPPYLASPSAPPKGNVSFGNAVTTAPPLSKSSTGTTQAKDPVTPPPEVTSPRSAERSLTPAATKDAGHTPFPTRTLPIDNDDNDDGNDAPGTMPSNKTTTNTVGILSSNPSASLTMPTSDSIISPELRMQKEMIQLQNEKTEALSKVAELETLVRKLKQHGAATSPPPGSNSTKQVGFGLLPQSTPLAATARTASSSSLSSPPPLSSPRPFLRAPTPFPKRPKQETPSSEEEQLDILRKAANSTAHEYETPIATYTIRRPFGLAVERDLWFAAGQLTHKLYEKKANPFQATSLEVVAAIHADQSYFCLYEDAMVRHQVDTSSEWKEYGNVSEQEQPLGNVSYIDADANERDYSLDEVFQGAVAVREHYCSSFCSVASHVQSNWKKEQEVPPAASAGMASTHPKVATKDAGVGTDAIATAEAAPPQGKPVGVGKDAPKKKSSKSVKPKEEIIDGAMPTFVSFFVNGIFSLLYFVFVDMPLKMVTTALVLLGASWIVATIYLYLQDPMVYGSHVTTAAFYNHAPGVL